jgi:hypothetical protein
VTVGHFVVRKLENPHILRTPFFSAAKLEKKIAQITREIRYVSYDWAKKSCQSALYLTFVQTVDELEIPVLFHCLEINN